MDSIKSGTGSREDSGTDVLFCNSDSSEDDEEVVDDSDNENESTPRKKNASIKLKVPPNILKIDLEKVDKAIDEKDSTKIGLPKNNTERIGFMINAANPKPKTKLCEPLSPQRSFNSVSTFHDNNETKKIAKRSKIYEPMLYRGYSNTKFSIIFYRKYSSRRDDETGEQVKILHKVRFLHRFDSEAEEIFALPSGSGRSVVTQWADINFPLSIASATLVENSVTAKEVKLLYGNRYLTKSKMRTGEALNQNDEFYLRFTPRIYTIFHADINNAELMKILGTYKNSKMQVRMESIMFPGAKIDMNKYAELCEKLSSIYNDPNFPRYISRYRFREQDYFCLHFPSFQIEEFRWLLVQGTE